MEGRSTLPAADWDPDSDSAIVCSAAAISGSPDSAGCAARQCVGVGLGDRARQIEGGRVAGRGDRRRGGGRRRLRQQRLGQYDDRGDPAALLLAQLDPYGVARGQQGGHLEAETGSVRVLFARLEERRVAQAGVELAHPHGRHADALVLHGEHHLTGLQQPAGELDMGVGRREGGGVLQEFGDEVAEVVGGEPGDLGVRRQGLDGDPLVPLNLADRRAQDVDQRNRTLVPVPVLGAREDQHVLAVAAHDRGHVVELEEGGEPFRVLLALLQRLDDPELTLDEAEVAQREVDEGVVDGVLQLLQLGRQIGHLDLEFGALDGECLAAA